MWKPPISVSRRPNHGKKVPVYHIVYTIDVWKLELSLCKVITHFFSSELLTLEEKEISICLAG